MRTIDLSTWYRREHFEFFNAFNHPHFSLCANVDLSRIYPYSKAHGYSMTAVILYVISRAANAIPAFRWRIRGAEVVEHETVSPSFTLLVENDLFGFCTIDYCQDFTEFAQRAGEQITLAKAHATLKDPPGRDDLLFMSVIPWVSFTSIQHPMRLHPSDSIPRFAWGKYFEEGGVLKMPLSVQAHHALMDGVHVGKFYAAVQDYLQRPEVVFALAQDRE
jgi:chloramphenicol O-acetyltransferase type A